MLGGNLEVVRRFEEQTEILVVLVWLDYAASIFDAVLSALDFVIEGVNVMSGHNIDIVTVAFRLVWNGEFLYSLAYHDIFVFLVNELLLHFRGNNNFCFYHKFYFF